MPLIDLDSMSYPQLQEEARQWTLEPTNYKNEKELKEAINSQREMRASRHPVYDQDVKDDMASKPSDPKARKFDDVVQLKNPHIKDSAKEATVTRPTPGEPENTNRKAEKANKEAEARDNNAETQDTNKPENPGAELQPRGKAQEILDKKNQQ